MVVLFLLSEVEVAISTRDESKRMRGMERRSKQLRVRVINHQNQKQVPLLHLRSQIAATRLPVWILLVFANLLIALHHPADRLRRNYGKCNFFHDTTTNEDDAL